jgi:hypothetical protein
MPAESPGVDLLQLVKAMQPREKRYFRLQTSRIGNASQQNYMRLYEEIQSMPAWSEAQIRKTFEGEPFLKQLNVACTYLYDLLLSSLRAYDQDKSFHSEAHRRLDEIVLLFQRKLHGPCLKRIQQGLKFGSQIDLPAFQLELLQWEIRLLRQFPGKHTWVRTQEAIEQSKALTLKYSQENVLYGLYSQLFLLSTRPGTDTTLEAEAMIQTIAADPILAIAPHGLGFDAQLLFHLIHSLLANHAGDGPRFVKANADMLHCWEANPRRIAFEEERYLKSLVGFVDSAVESPLLGAVPNALAKMRRICHRSPVLEEGYGLIVLHLELRFLLNTKAFEGAVVHTEAMWHYLAQREQGSLPTGYITACTNAALAHFLMESWQGCLKWLSKIESANKREIRVAVTQWVGPLRIVALYASNQLDELEKALRNWRKHPDAGFLAALISDAFSALNHSNSDAEERVALEQLRFGIAQNQTNAPVLSLVGNWVTSRLKTIPLRNFYQT